MFDIIKSIILGIIEGITEFLPISSTGHLYLANDLLHLDQSPEFINMFMVVIQLGAILSVIVLYFHKLNPFTTKKTTLEIKQTWSLWAKVLVATIPSIIIGLPLNDWMDEHLTSWSVIASTLFVYGVLYIILERFNKNRKPILNDLNKMTYRFALAIGFCQVLSLIPGTSRSGSTILGAMFFGASRFVSAEFSFFLGIPTMFGASLLKLYKFFSHGGQFVGLQLPILLIGMVVSFIVAYLAIKFLLNYVKSHDFTAFGWYRIILAIVVVLFFGLLK
ncbi:undecaprenyl-diphosphate phosphatase [Holzapfeliella floricola]|uniref:Undecaprenyl-diphosphatase n=1 Tax=Holzapfeliella floricola DSM 23037 = JCM 16512 TaxID=1423744 RepID=A0A0R2DJB6_9LACO|nr:undecaprenyl-diphosphate phosphatase [Holzapfeliella floricola]KRN04193.1 bacitracin resistance protein [Holzapfeliella floricola DSM 23037 = JCM 16512]